MSESQSYAEFETLLEGNDDALYWIRERVGMGMDDGMTKHNAEQNAIAQWKETETRITF